MLDLSCPGDSSNCYSHFHVEDSRYLAKTIPTHLENNLVADRSMTSAGSVIENGVQEAQEAQEAQNPSNEKAVILQKIIRNFTPSYV